MKSIPTGSNLLQVRSQNLAAVFAAIRHLGLVSRTELAEHTQLTSSTITNLVNELLRWNLLIEAGSAASQGGRKRTMLSLNPAAGWVIALAAYPTEIQGGLVDLTGQVGWRETLPINEAETDQAVCAAHQLYERLHLQAQERRWDVVGTGVAGCYSEQFAVEPWWRTYVPQEMSSQLTVKREYLVRAAAMAEMWYGCGRNHSSLIYFDEMITPHIGVMLGNQLFVGAHGHAGSLPIVHHLAVDEFGLDAEVASKVTAAVYAFDPGVVVLDSRVSPDRAARWKQWISEHVVHKTSGNVAHQSGPQVCVSALGADAALVGAACVVLEDFFIDPIGQLTRMSVAPQWNLARMAYN